MGLLQLLDNPVALILTAVSLLVAITIHEFAHAFAADKLGDPTPRSDGRVTLNPLAHLDPIGTIMLIVIGFGWGKPVMFDPRYLKDQVRDTAIIAFAGPLSNLLLALVAAIVLPLIGSLVPSLGVVLLPVLGYTIFYNCMLAIFNLVPIHPLDGGKILSAFLPPTLSVEYDRFLYQYGSFILLALIFPWWNGMSPLSALISPPINVLVGVYAQLAITMAGIF